MLETAVVSCDHSFCNHIRLQKFCMAEFARINRLPPYVFAIVNDLKMQLRRKGEDIVDLGMGNSDLATPQHYSKQAGGSGQ